MWIRRGDYDRLVSDLATAKATVEWMRVQVNTAQAEKAALLSAVTKMPVMTPTIREAGSSPIAPSIGPGPTPDTFSSQLAAMFEDVGDDAAASLKIDHDPLGTVVYR